MRILRNHLALALEHVGNPDERHDLSSILHGLLVTRDLDGAGREFLQTGDQGEINGDPSGFSVLEQQHRFALTRVRHRNQFVCFLSFGCFPFPGIAKHVGALCQAEHVED